MIDKSQLLFVVPVLPSSDLSRDIVCYEEKTGFEEFLERGTLSEEKLRLNTPWNTNEFVFLDLNNNAVFLVEELV